MSEPLHTLISQFLAKHLPLFETLISVEKLTAGASQATLRITATVAGANKCYALRHCPEASSGGTEDGIGLQAEAQVIATIAQASIPGPAIIAVLSAGDGLGDGFLMHWLEGETLGHKINRSPELSDVRPTLAAQCGELLAHIHAVDIQATGLSKTLHTYCASDLVKQSWQHYQALEADAPMIDYTARWLLDNLPEAQRQTLVHGDFRNGNLMVNPTGITAVLDWELAHIGDPMRDLGYLCVNSWRFGNAELAVGGFGHTEALLSAYEAASGTKVCTESIKFWQVFGSFWWSITCLGMAQSYRDGSNTSVERPAIGRRSSEAQMDCVNLIIPGSFAGPSSKPLIAHSKGDPTEAEDLASNRELIQSVSDFLKAELASELPNDKRFLARVAANSLAIVQRELTLAPQLAIEEHNRLQTLLQSKDELHALRKRLVLELRTTLPLNQQGLAEHLRETVAGRLAVDQPGYAALQQPEHC